jgi:hypothetical protein
VATGPNTSVSWHTACSGCAAEQGRAQAAGHGRVGVDQGVAGAVMQGVGLLLQGARPAHAVELRAADQRAHAHRFVARVAHGGLGQRAPMAWAAAS